MASEQNKEIAEKIRKVYNTFLAKLQKIKTERDETIKEILNNEDQKKIQEKLRDIRNL